MKASDISDAICAMEAAWELINSYVPAGTEGSVVCQSNLLMASIRLKVELSLIAVEIKTAK